MGLLDQHTVRGDFTHPDSPLYPPWSRQELFHEEDYYARLDRIDNIRRVSHQLPHSSVLGRRHVRLAVLANIDASYLRGVWYGSSLLL